MACLKPLNTLKTRRECALKLLEEASEACEAMKLLDKLLEKARSGDDLVHFDTIKAYKESALRELADVAQCMCNCLQLIRVPDTEWEDAVRDVQERNAKRGRREIDTGMALTVDWGEHD